MDRDVVIWCRICDIPMKLHTDRGKLQVTYPSCEATFIWTPPSQDSPSPEQAEFPHKILERKMLSRPIWPIMGVFLVGLFAFVVYGGYVGKQNSGTGRSGLFSSGHKRHEIKIEYSNLVDRSILTHSGESVGALLNEVSKQGLNEVLASNLQPYLEPFSFICNEIVTSIKQNPDEIPYLNAIAEYPPGSKQPAWAALFRGGQYQMFVNENRIRLFLPGNNPMTLFEDHRDVLRYPVARVMDEMAVESVEIEVYAFGNDYITQTIKLDTNPFVTKIAREWVESDKAPLHLAALDRFFGQPIKIEAAEVDVQGNFFLYGIPSKTQEKVAGNKQSLSDFAVVYRSVFHNGKNPPYISLDNHEDNRYAKVNFGGYLEDTNVGSVVLEADKLFKTISTGFDPNTRKSTYKHIKRGVPAFITEAERSLKLPKESGMIQIRYWFYPDKITTVTDGKIGVVETPRFLADAERMDTQVTLGKAQRDAIDHLNQNFEQYASVLSPFKDLDTVGRMMAIVNWLKDRGLSSKVDFESLLSVELPAFSTPRKNYKLLTVTASIDVIDNGRITYGKPKAYCLDDVLAKLSPSGEDEEYLNSAGRWFDEQDSTDLLPEKARAISKRLDKKGSKINDLEKKLTVMQDRLEREERTLNQYNGSEVDRFNNMVDDFNAMRVRYLTEVDAHDKDLELINNMDIDYHLITGVGGGINMRPKDFAKPSYKPKSPRVQRIRDFKNNKGLVGKDGKPGLVRSGFSAGAKRLYEKSLPKPWMVKSPAESSNSGKTIWERSDGTTASIESINDGAHRKLSIRNPKYFNDTTISISEGGSAVVSVVETSQYPSQIIITGSSKPGGTIVLKPGEIIPRSANTPIWE